MSARMLLEAAAAGPHLWTIDGGARFPGRIRPNLRWGSNRYAHGQTYLALPAGAGRCPVARRGPRPQHAGAGTRDGGADRPAGRVHSAPADPGPRERAGPAPADRRDPRSPAESERP